VSEYYKKFKNDIFNYFNTDKLIVKYGYMCYELGENEIVISRHNKNTITARLKYNNAWFIDANFKEMIMKGLPKYIDYFLNRKKFIIGHNEFWSDKFAD